MIGATFDCSLMRCFVTNRSTVKISRVPATWTHLFFSAVGHRNGQANKDDKVNLNKTSQVFILAAQAGKKKSLHSMFLFVSLVFVRCPLENKRPPLAAPVLLCSRVSGTDV